MGRHPHTPKVKANLGPNIPIAFFSNFQASCVLVSPGLRDISQTRIDQTLHMGVNTEALTW